MVGQFSIETRSHVCDAQHIYDKLCEFIQLFREIFGTFRPLRFISQKFRVFGLCKKIYSSL